MRYFVLLFFMVVGFVGLRDEWKSLPPEEQLKILNQVQQLRQAVQQEMVDQKLTTTQEFKAAFLKNARTNSRFQQALVVYGLFLFNIWFLPLITVSRLRRLKQELFELHPDLLANNLFEAQETPFYTRTFFSRINILIVPGLPLAFLAYFFLPVACIFAAIFAIGALIEFKVKTLRYESAENYRDSLDPYYNRRLLSHFILPLVPEAQRQVFKDTLENKKNAS